VSPPIVMGTEEEEEGFPPLGGWQQKKSVTILLSD
jgi:hypothetical protein